MKSKIIKYSVVLASIAIVVSVAAQAQPSVSATAVPESQSQHDYWLSTWKDSNDYEKSAELAYYKGNYKEAEALCHKSMDAAPLTPDGKSHQGNWETGDVLAMIYIREQKYADAIKVYNDLHAAEPNLYRGASLEQLNLALCYLRLGKYDEAAAHFRESGCATVRILSPNDPPVSDYPGTDTPVNLETSILMYRGSFMAAFGSSKSEGLIDLRQAHELMPDNPIVADYLARNLSARDDRVEILALCKIIAKYGHGKSMVEDAKSKIPLYEYSLAHEK